VGRNGKPHGLRILPKNRKTQREVKKKKEVRNYKTGRGGGREMRVRTTRGAQNTLLVCQGERRRENVQKHAMFLLE